MNSGLRKVGGPIEVYDCTPREARQARGVHFSFEALVAIINQLNELGVDVIECGWPGANKTWDRLFEAIASGQVPKSATTKLAAFASTRRAKLSVESDPLFQKLLASPVDIMTIFGKSWDIHVTQALCTTLSNNLKMVEESVSAICQAGKRAIFDAEHFFQSAMINGNTYAFEVLEAALAGGADTLVLCDTNGVAQTWDVQEIVSQVFQTFGDRAQIGVHMHNDRGMALPNTMMALRSGARHFQGTINGYSERVSMACTLEVIGNIVLAGREDAFWANLGPDLNCIPKVNYALLSKTSRLIDQLAGLHPNTRKIFVGAAARTHKAGAHVSGGERAGYTIYESHQPEWFGSKRSIVLSGMSGKTGVVAFIKANWGIEKVSPETIDAILAEIERLEEFGYSFDSASGSAALLVARFLWPERNQLTFGDYHFSTAANAPKGSMVAHIEVGDLQFVSALGDGPVDALWNAALKHMAPKHSCLAGVLLDEYAPYQLTLSDGSGGSASAMRVEINWDCPTFGHFTTQGVSTNIIDASWEAIKEAVNLVITKQWRAELNLAPIH